LVLSRTTPAMLADCMDNPAAAHLTRLLQLQC